MITQENIPYTADEIKAMVKTIEELRKKYNGVLGRAKEIHRNEDEKRFDMEWLFPELKEGEKERIRKDIISYLRNEKIVKRYVSDIEVDKWIDWLEKQAEPNPYSGVSFKYNDHIWGMCARDNGVEIIFDGELKAFLSLEKSFIYPIYPKPDLEAIKEENIDNQNCVKSTDKVESKFKVGKWIVFNGLVLYIYEIVDGYYKTVDIDGIPCSYDWAMDNIARLWSINDVKKGDVLVDEDNNIGLYSGEKDDLYWHSCIYLGCDDYLRGSMGYHKHKNTKPATKEQRDLLFSKMRESGYEWDPEKKELKKIEVVSKESEDERIRKGIIRNLQFLMDRSEGFVQEDLQERITWLENQCEQKQTWRPSAAQLIVIKSLIEDKNTSKVNKVILRGMLDEFKQLTNTEIEP